jgi:hypothetical protein
MRSSSRMPPSFLLLLLLERAPKPDAKITPADDIFSLDLLSAPKPKLFVKKEICDFCCAEKSAKILKATAFFFFLSFEENFRFRFFQSSEEKSSQLISLFCFFSSATIYTHTRFAAFQQNTTVKAFCVREKERYREK